MLCNPYNGKSLNFIPILSTFGIPQLIEASDMYERIYAYLGWLKDNPGVSGIQTNKEKVISHGFDAKCSFLAKNEKNLKILLTFRF